MPRRITGMKWYVAVLGVVAAAAVSGGVAFAQSQSGPSLHSSTSGAGPGTVSGPNGQFVPANGSTPPAAPAGSTAYGSKVSGSGKVVRSHRTSRAAVRRGSASGPSYSSGPKGSGPGTVSGPDGQFVQVSGSAPPAAPAGSTTHSSQVSGSGQAVNSSP
jgi:hypothetical protein